MPENRISDLGDLTPMTQEIIEIVKKYTRSDGVGIALSFTLAPNYDICHYVSNLDRKEGCHMFAYSASLFDK